MALLLASCLFDRDAAPSSTLAGATEGDSNSPEPTAADPPRSEIRDARLAAGERDASGRLADLPDRATASSEVSGRLPSSAFYPRRDPLLVEGLARGDERMALEGLARSFARREWTDRTWEKRGYIELAGAHPGFVSGAEGESRPQPAGQFHLGCMGGFLEGVRLLHLPTLARGTLARCDDEADGCGLPEEDGRHALRRLARILPAGEVGRLREGSQSRSSLAAALPRPHWTGLCSVGHRARAQGDALFFHHMMILLPKGEDGFWLFDATGMGGIRFKATDEAGLRRYVVETLANNRAMGYRPDSAELVCLETKPAFAPSQRAGWP